MAMHFTCTLTCGRCKATLTFTDERPAWKTYDYRVEMADECERAARFVAEHADEPDDGAVFQRPPWHEAYIAAGRPSFIKREVIDPDFLNQGARHLIVDIPEPYRYVDCPVCDARVREPAA